MSFATIFYTHEMDPYYSYLSLITTVPLDSQKRGEKLPPRRLTSFGAGEPLGARCAPRGCLSERYGLFPQRRQGHRHEAEPQEPEDREDARQANVALIWCILIRP